MPATIVPGDMEVRGNLSAQTFTVPNASVGNAQIKSGVSDQIAAAKIEHNHRAELSQESATPVATVARVVHVVEGQAGTILAVRAGNVVAAIGAYAVNVDVLKNGVSILTGTILLDSTTTAYTVLVAGVISSSALIAGDVLEIVITDGGGGGTAPDGVFAYIDLREDGS